MERKEVSEIKLDLLICKSCFLSAENYKEYDAMGSHNLGSLFLEVS